MPNDAKRENSHNGCVTKQRTRAAEWMDAKFIKWRGDQTERRAPVEKFAQTLGISRDDFYNVMKGGGLSPMKVARIAEATGDESVYEIFETGRPDPIRWAFEKILEALSPEDRKKWLQEGEELVQRGKEKSKRAERKAKAESNP